jgi:hypothetical protein
MTWNLTMTLHVAEEPTTHVFSTVWTTTRSTPLPCQVQGVSGVIMKKGGNERQLGGRKAACLSLILETSKDPTRFVSSVRKGLHGVYSCCIATLN